MNDDLIELLIERLELYRCPDCEEWLFYEFGPCPKPEAVKSWIEGVVYHLRDHHDVSFLSLHLQGKIACSP